MLSGAAIFNESGDLVWNEVGLDSFGTPADGTISVFGPSPGDLLFVLHGKDAGVTRSGTSIAGKRRVWSVERMLRRL